MHAMYQRKVDVDMLNAVKSVLADVSSVSPSSEQRDTRPDSAEWTTLEQTGRRAIVRLMNDLVFCIRRKKKNERKEQRKEQRKKGRKKERKKERTGRII